MYLQIKITIFGTFNNKGASINIKILLRHEKEKKLIILIPCLISFDIQCLKELNQIILGNCLEQIKGKSRHLYLYFLKFGTTNSKCILTEDSKTWLKI